LFFRILKNILLFLNKTSELNRFVKKYFFLLSAFDPNNLFNL
jgi:hypothetical protein